MKLKAYAKTNLFLNVVGKDEKGYHLLDMLNSSISLYDEVELEKADDITCDGAYFENNTAIKAAEAFCKRYKTGGVKISIKKNIPVGGGLGGSSTNAAAVIYGMSKLYKKTMLLHDIENFSCVGADVPFMINGGLAKVSGIGDKVRALPFSLSLHGVVVKPESSNETKRVYETFDLLNEYTEITSENILKAAQNLGAFTEAERLDMVSKEEGLSGLRKKLLEYDLFDHMYNGLGNAAKLCTKEIAEIEKTLSKLKAKAVIVSGSGSSVIGFFTKEKAKEVENELQGKYPFVKAFSTMPQGIEIITE